MKPIKEFKGEFRFLSNFWPVKVRLDGVEYPTVEHAYQAAKFLDGSKQRAAIRFLSTPGEAKRFARGKEHRPEWDNLKTEIMRGLLQQKFSNMTLRARLCATYPRHLEEGNRWGDTFWGVDLKDRVGLNTLGRMLEDIRADILETPWE